MNRISAENPARNGKNVLGSSRIQHLIKLRWLATSWLALLAISLLLFLCVFLVSWGKAKPEEVFSSLRDKFEIGSDFDEVFEYAKSNGFDFSLYEPHQGKLVAVNGTPALSPRVYFPKAPADFFSNCFEDCTVLRTSKSVEATLLGMKFRHSYRYLWLFKKGELFSSHEENGFWAFILK